MLDFHLMTAVQDLQTRLENLEKGFNEFKKEIIKNHNELVDYVKDHTEDLEDRVSELEGSNTTSEDTK